jgi:prefoldin subunit 5
MLKSQAQMLTQQLSHINARIAQLEAQLASEEG